MTLVTAALYTAVQVINWFETLARGGLYFVGFITAVWILSAVVDGDTERGFVEYMVPFVGLLLWVLLVFGVLFAVLWTLAKVPEYLSQYREYVADRAAAELTGDPGALATALEQLSGQSVAESDLRSVDAQFRGLFLLPWSADGVIQDGGPTIRDAYRRGPDQETSFDADDLIDALVDSHPPTDERIERLRAMERSLETSA